MFYEHNILTKVKIKLRCCELDDAKRIVADVLSINDRIFSYLIYAKYKDSQLTGWQIECNVSHTPRYNCIDTKVAVAEIYALMELSLSSNDMPAVIGYRRPPLDIQLEVLEPLTKKLAIEQSQAWKLLEYDDLCQMCRLGICTLYNKGYYLHKNLIRRTFVNSVLMQLRKYRQSPDTVSLYDPVGIDEDGSEISWMDVTPDETAKSAILQAENDEAETDVLTKKRQIVIDKIGQRQYDQLLREYGNKLTTNIGRHVVNKLKRHLAAMGLDSKSFNHLL